jgi:carboxyl-terminal processing protease
MQQGSGIPGWVAPPRSDRKLVRASVQIAIVALVFMAGIAFERSQYVETPGLDEIASAWYLLHDEYVAPESLDPDALAYGAIQGMAEAVGDTGHTYFLTPEEAAMDDALMSGSLGWIGAYFADPDDPLRVSEIDPGDVADHVGMAVGDRVVAVDGVSTEGPDGDAILDRIVGRPGAVVVLSVERSGVEHPLEFSLRRTLYAYEDVTWAMVPSSSIGVVRLAQFSEAVGTEVATAVTAAEAAGASGLILDLRGNPGGLLDEAEAVAWAFLRPGETILIERDRNGEETKHSVPPAARRTELPLVVLVDADSASSAEVVAGALQDAHRATVVGVRTAGTGTILEDWEFEDGAVFSIGTSRWFTPSGRSAWHVGLAPDIEVRLPDGVRPMRPDDLDSVASVDEIRDTQLLQAIVLLTADQSPEPAS